MNSIVIIEIFSSMFNFNDLDLNISTNHSTANGRHTHTQLKTILSDLFSFFGFWFNREETNSITTLFALENEMSHQ